MSPVVKRKREKFSIPSKYLLLILTGVCIALMTITFLTDYTPKTVNKVVGYIVVPFQDGVSRVGSWISTRVDELGELRVVLQENQEFKEQIAELTIQNTQLQQDKYELNNLRELYKLDEQYSGYEKVGTTATVTAGLSVFSVRAEVCRVLTLHTELTANFVQTFYLLVRKFLRTAQLLGDVEQLCIELNRLHFVISTQKAIREGESAVVLKQNCIERL